MNLYAPCDVRPASNRVRYQFRSFFRKLLAVGEGIEPSHPSLGRPRFSKPAHYRSVIPLQSGTRRGIRTHTVLFLRQTPPANWAIRANLVQAEGLEPSMFSAWVGRVTADCRRRWATPAYWCAEWDANPQTVGSRLTKVCPSPITDARSNCQRSGGPGGNRTHLGDFADRHLTNRTLDHRCTKSDMPHSRHSRRKSKRPAVSIGPREL